MALTSQSRVSMRENLVSAEIDGDMVVMDVMSGRYVAIGGPGALLTEMLLKEPRSVEDLCAAAQDAYEIDEASCRSQIMDFVSQLQSQGLATVAA